ncbi:6292_t:CDS:2, partial [Acaulospora colombiana]
DFAKSKVEIEKCLKPGGLMLWIDGDYHVISEDPHVYIPLASEINPEGCYLGRMFWEMRRCAVKVGRSDLFTMTDELKVGLWKDPLLDPETTSQLIMSTILQSRSRYMAKRPGCKPIPKTKIDGYSDTARCFGEETEEPMPPYPYLFIYDTEEQRHESQAKLDK